MAQSRLLMDSEANFNVPPAIVTRDATPPILYRDVIIICMDRGKMHAWLREKGLIGNFNGQLCEKCYHGQWRLIRDRTLADEWIWRCNNIKCHKKKSIRIDSWFSKSKLKLEQIIEFTYLWSKKCNQTFIREELQIGSCTTLVDWFNFAREVCAEIMEADNEQIGGEGKEVEIDESKFGKRKFNRGRRVDGCWVFGGIERGSDKMFLSIVEDRSAATLVPIIQKYIKVGTKIHSDCWKAYSRLNTLGYEHVTVNHSKEFYNHENDACTNTIESTWRAVKQSLPKYGTVKTLYDSYFVEYMIRRKYLKSNNDKFLGFLKLVKRVYNPDKSAENIENDPPVVMAHDNSSQDMFPEMD